MNEYTTLLRKHDWFYNYSDDFSVWQKGREQRDRLIQLRLEIDPRWLIWDQYAPNDFKHKGG